MIIALVKVPRISRALLALDLFVVGTTCCYVNFIADSIDLKSTLAKSLDFGVGSMFGGLVGCIYYIAIVVSTLFVMGLYQRRYMNGLPLVKSGFVAAVLAWLLGVWPITETDSFRSELSTTGLAIYHITLFAFLIVARPLMCKLFDSFAKKRRLAVVGSEAMISLMKAISDRAFPAELVVVNYCRVNCASEKDILMQTLTNLSRRGDIDDIVVDLPSTEVELLRTSSSFDVGGTSHMRLIPKSVAIEQNARWSDTHEAAEAVAHVSKNAAARTAKYLFERMLAMCGLVFTLPVMIGVIIAIRLDDGGPILYRQDRVGKDNRVFRILKFRSMKQNSEADGKARWADIDDCRVTRVGHFIRKTRIDELPQLINIARGEMALVGPRPERPEIVEQLAAQIPGYELRHVVHPGLTGWAQINFPYGADLKSAVRKTEFDLYYIKNWSIWIDLAIMAQTVRVVLFAEGGR